MFCHGQLQLATSAGQHFKATGIQFTGLCSLGRGASIDGVTPAPCPPYACSHLPAVRLFSLSRAAR